jgi:hypothetical protein
MSHLIVPNVQDFTEKKIYLLAVAKLGIMMMELTQIVLSAMSLVFLAMRDLNTIVHLVLLFFLQILIHFSVYRAVKK